MLIITPELLEFRQIQNRELITKLVYLQNTGSIPICIPILSLGSSFEGKYSGGSFSNTLPSTCIEPAQTKTIEFRPKSTQRSIELEKVLDFTYNEIVLNITSIGGEIFVWNTPIVAYEYTAITHIDVYYQINGGTLTLKQSNVPVSSGYSFSLAGISFNDLDTLRVIIKDHNSSVQDYIEYSVRLASLEITSLNEDVPLTLAGSYEDGVHYFIGVNGDIVESTSPLRSGVFAGIGNSDKNIDLDIKTLALELDAFSAPVLLDVNFTVSGTATLVSNKVYIEAYNGSVWVDLNNGNPIDVVLGIFELTTAQLKASDGFESGNVYVVRARDFDGYATSSQENIETYDIIYGTTEEGGAVVEDEIGNIFTFSD